VLGNGLETVPTASSPAEGERGFVHEVKMSVASGSQGERKRDVAKMVKRQKFQAQRLYSPLHKKKQRNQRKGT